MVSKEEIKKLAELARIGISDAEAENLRGDMDSILDYVSQVSDVAKGAEGAEEIAKEDLINVMRSDENPTPSGTYSKELIAEFPESERNYLKVKKIL